jgi:hypothetical protein
MFGFDDEGATFYLTRPFSSLKPIDTAQGFCFNFARFFSAAAPLLAGVLTSAHGSFAPAIATIGSIYFAGLIILLFARETNEKPLPD